MKPQCFSEYRSHIPNILTLSRVALGITVLPFLIAYYVKLDISLVNVYIAFFFIMLSMTDFLDGYLARKYSNISTIGAFLDPIADKFLLLSSLISLVFIHKLHFSWAIILISREFFVMALRHLGLLYNIEVKVSALAKYKTAFQFLYTTLLILVPYSYVGLKKDSVSMPVLFMNLFLLGVVMLSLMSAYNYYVVLMRKIKKNKINC